MILKRIEKTDLSVCDSNSTFLQSGFWGAFKSRFDWEALPFIVEWENNEKQKEVKPLLVLHRRLLPGYTLAYIPWGPELPSWCINYNTPLLDLAEKLKEILPNNTVFIRFDPPWQMSSPLIPKMMPSCPLIRSAVDIQPSTTVVLDLSQSMDSIISKMKPKWRYNSRLAQKKGVKVFQADSDKIMCFYKLLKITAQRDGISIHSFEYYNTLFKHDFYDGIKPEIRLYLAQHEDDIIAGIVTLFRNREAVYLYGASSDIKRNLMPSYALQLKAIEEAKAYGCIIYDLFGIPPNDNPDHPMAGLYRFKTGFGGTIIHRPGSWDYPLRPFIYKTFRIVELLRKRL